MQRNQIVWASTVAESFWNALENLGRNKTFNLPSASFANATSYTTLITHVVPTAEAEAMGVGLVALSLLKPKGVLTTKSARP